MWRCQHGLCSKNGFPSALTCSNWPEKRETLLLILWQIGCGSNFMTKCISLIRLLRKVTQGNLIKSGEEWLNCWTLIMKTPPWTNSFFFFFYLFIFLLPPETFVLSLAYCFELVWRWHCYKTSGQQTERIYACNSDNHLVKNGFLHMSSRMLLWKEIFMVILLVFLRAFLCVSSILKFPWPFIELHLI